MNTNELREHIRHLNDLEKKKQEQNGVKMANIKLDTTMMQWLSEPVANEHSFYEFCNQYEFVKLRKETDHCYTVYFDKNYSEQTHDVLDSALDQFQVKVKDLS